jgi:hypothetical protein
MMPTWEAITIFTDEDVEKELLVQANTLEKYEGLDRCHYVCHPETYEQVKMNLNEVRK